MKHEHDHQNAEKACYMYKITQANLPRRVKKMKILKIDLQASSVAYVIHNANEEPYFVLPLSNSNLHCTALGDVEKACCLSNGVFFVQHSPNKQHYQKEETKNFEIQY